MVTPTSTMPPPCCFSKNGRASKSRGRRRKCHSTINHDKSRECARSSSTRSHGGSSCKPLNGTHRGMAYRQVELTVALVFKNHNRRNVERPDLFSPRLWGDVGG